MWKKKDKKVTAIDKTNTSMDHMDSGDDIPRNTKAANNILSNKQKGTAIEKTHMGKEYTESDVDIVKGTKGTTRIRSNGGALLAVVKRDTANALKVHQKNIDIFWRDDPNSKKPVQRTLRHQKQKIIESIYTAGKGNIANTANLLVAILNDIKVLALLQNYSFPDRSLHRFRFLDPKINV